MKDQRGRGKGEGQCGEVQRGGLEGRGKGEAEGVGGGGIKGRVIGIKV